MIEMILRFADLRNFGLRREKITCMKNVLKRSSNSGSDNRKSEMSGAAEVSKIDMVGVLAIFVCARWGDCGRGHGAAAEESPSDRVSIDDRSS